MSVRKRVRKDGTTAWYYDFMVEGIRYRGIGGTTKTQALRAQEKVRNKVLNGEYEIVEKVGSIKLEAFIEIFLRRRQHLKSIKRDVLSTKNLLSVFKGRSLKEITPADIEDYIGFRREKGVANGTINRELTCLKRIYNLAIRWSHARRNPMDSVDMLKEPPARSRFLSKEEAVRLIDTAEPYFKPVLLTALYTGMRLGEILGLCWERVHVSVDVGPVIELRETKNNKVRYIPLNDELIQMFKSLPHHAEDSRVFWGKRGKPLRDVRKPFMAACKKAGIHDFRFHDLRHTFASHFVMSGGDLLTLKEILGHSSLDMVQRYSHLAQAHKRRQMNNMTGLFSNCHLFVTAPQTAQNGVSLNQVKTNPAPIAQVDRAAVS